MGLITASDVDKVLGTTKGFVAKLVQLGVTMKRLMTASCDEELLRQIASLVMTGHPEAMRLLNIGGRQLYVFDCKYCGGADSTVLDRLVTRNGLRLAKVAENDALVRQVGPEFWEDTSGYIIENPPRIRLVSQDGTRKPVPEGILPYSCALIVAARPDD